MSGAIRAEIVGQRYGINDVSADTLPGLCVKLLAAGFDGECYRPGQPTWDMRARAVRAGAALARERGGGGQDSQPPREASPRASPGLADSSKKLPVAYRTVNLVWHGLKLHLRTPDRVLAVLKSDPAHPSLYRVCALDYVSDLLNLTRAKDAAISFALAVLNREVAIKRASKQRVRS